MEKCWAKTICCAKPKQHVLFWLFFYPFFKILLGHTLSTAGAACKQLHLLMLKLPLIVRRVYNCRPGAGDDASSIGVMIELLRALSSVHSGFKNSVIFLFNTAEEEGSTGSHGFITQVLYSIEFL
jgi:hypothetical protein